MFKKIARKPPLSPLPPLPGRNETDGIKEKAAQTAVALPSPPPLKKKEEGERKKGKATTALEAKALLIL